MKDWYHDIQEYFMKGTRCYVLSATATALLAGWAVMPVYLDIYMEGPYLAAGAGLVVLCILCLRWMDEKYVQDKDEQETDKGYGKSIGNTYQQ